MNEGRELWKEYCGFLDKSFSEQLEYNEKKKEEHFEKWKHTKTAKQLRPEGVEKFEDIPITTYEDYPILHEFGKKIEELERTVPRKKGERLWEYYNGGIGRQAARMLDGWMTDRYGFCMKTSGTGGETKWFAHSEKFLKSMIKYTIAYLIISCSDDWGDTQIRKGDKILCMVAPPPYGSSFVTKAWDDFFSCVPPPQIIENITDMRKKMNMVARIIKSGEKIAYVVGLPSTLYLISQYLSTPAEVFKDRYESMHLGIGKSILYLKYLQSKMSSPEYRRISEIMSIKGLNVGGTHYGLYLDSLKQQYGVDPYNIYANSEACLSLIGSLKLKESFIPLLEIHYYEFMGRDGKIRQIHELEKGNVYTLITTPFDNMVVRINTEDTFKVVDFEQNGLPILAFESRVADLLDIYGYLYLSEALATAVLTKAGLKHTDTWAIAKVIEPTEHLLLLMEKTWDYSDEEVSRAVFDSLKKISEDFRNLIRDYKIERPTKFIKVEYLPKGAFMRYIMKKAKEGVPFGQIKPPKLINPEKSELIDFLRKA